MNTLRFLDRPTRDGENARPLRNAIASRRAAVQAHRVGLSLESLECRVLLDAGLGSEIAAFASQEELQSFLVERAVEQNQWFFGREVNNSGCGGYHLADVDYWCEPVFYDLEVLPFANQVVPPNAGGGPGGLTGGVAVSDSPESDMSFSDTNVQVTGVDEGDIVETDGNYVYILSGNELVIIDVRDQAQPRIASRLELAANTYGSEMYLDGDRVMVVSSSWGQPDDIFFPPIIGNPILIEPMFASSYYYPQAQSITATVIDVTDREAPSIVTSTEIDGSLTNSRVVDGTAYLVANNSPSFPFVQYATDVTVGEEASTKYVYETEAEYRSRIEPVILEQVLTTYTTFDAMGEEIGSGIVSEFDTTWRTDSPDYFSLVSVVSLDMRAAQPTVDEMATVLMGAGHNMYMDHDSIYLFQNRWDAEQTTSIMKFQIDATSGDIEPAASGIISGRMLNQFSADEHNGLLRVATTTGWGDESSSGVYILEQVDDALTLKGGVSGLAAGEQIFSARFVGDRGYIVTFRQVDPLFAINLSDPANPIVEGELKIPGFSEYMQPIGEDHLLAIGRDADPTTGRREELQVSLFDVSDMTDPQLVDRYTFEGEHTYSPAEHDHHAFSWFPEYDTLAIPVHSNEGVWVSSPWGWRDWVTSEWDESLHVFQVDVETGFEFVGAIDHPSQVQRSLRVGQALYSLSRDTLKVNAIADPSQQFGMVHFERPENGGVIPERPTPVDIDRIFAGAESGENDERLDADGNSVVDEDDVVFIVEAIVSTEMGDTDLDGDVDFIDFLAISGNFGSSGGWADGDLNGDGEVDFEDFTILSGNYTG